MIKRILSVFVIFVLIIALVSCGKAEKPSSASTDISSYDNSSTVADDLTDPENFDYKSESGATVTAEELTPKKGLANGIDVSKWQGKIDWSSVKKSGIDFAVIRIGYRGEDGVIYKDSHADYNIQQAEKAGILIGIYFFSTAKSTSEAKEEADWTASAIKGYPISYPVTYNCEGFLNPQSRMAGLTNSARTDNALAFLSRIEEKGYEGMFYAAISELSGSRYWDTERIESKYEIWVAHYSSPSYPEKEAPDYTGKYGMWQYTDKGNIKGIKGNTDMVVSYFTRQKAKPKSSSARPGNASAPSEDGLIYTAVSEEVTAKDVTNLRSAATTKSDIVARLQNGTFIKRVGIGSNGWSKLIYGGKTVYAISSYLTTDKSFSPPKENDGFTPKSGKLTAKDTTNLRSEPNTESEIIATIKNGEFATCVAVSSSGWTRLLYGNKTVYAKSSLLTDKVNEKPTVSEEAPKNDEFISASGKVTAKDTTNLRTGPSTEGTEIVHTLKKGEFAELLGKSSKGWARISYKGQTVYAVYSYLLTEEEYNKEQQSEN